MSESIQLAVNFWLAEFLRSETAEAHGIVIRPDRDQLLNLQAQATAVWQPARRELGRITISSGLRPDEVNRLVGGADDSQHRTGEASDGWAAHASPRTLAEVIKQRCVFDQLILEHDQGVVHVSHSRIHNRREVLTRRRNGNGDLVYTLGLN